MELHRVAHHLRNEEVVLELLDGGIEDHHRHDRGRRHRERDEDRRDRRDDRADDGEPLEHAGDEREHERELSELAEADDGEDRQADRRGEEDGRAEQELAAHPATPDASEDGEECVGVGAPCCRQRTLHRGREPLPVLEHEEEPDRDDDESQDEGRRADERLDHRSGDRLHDLPERLLGAHDRGVDDVPQLGRQGERLVPGDDRCLPFADRGAVLRRVLDQLAGLLPDRRQRERDEQPGDADHERVGEEHAGPARHAPPLEKRHDRVEDERERETDDECRKRAARRPHEPGDEDDHGEREERQPMAFQCPEQLRDDEPPVLAPTWRPIAA